MKIYLVKYFSMAGTYSAVVRADSKKLAAHVFYMQFKNEVAEDSCIVDFLGRAKDKEKAEIIMASTPSV